MANKRRLMHIFILLLLLPSLPGRSEERLSFDDIILDIYNAVTEMSETDYEQLQTDLYALHESPIDLNNTSDEELQQLYFLSPQQIDALLSYADKHPFEDLYELRLIPCLADYEIRNLLPFVTISHPSSAATGQPLYAREVFAHANHELITRIDARNIEGYRGSDPMYVQTRYRFDYRRRVTFGAQLRRPAGGGAEVLQYGAYIRLRDIGHLHTFVAGDFQASFGRGLVLAPVFHAGKTVYVSSAGQQPQGLRPYSSADGEGLHGLGATLRWEWGKSTRLDVSALYSLKQPDDSTWQHTVGANMTVRHKRLEVQLTAVENIWSDSIHPYNNAQYNRHYFRGTNQAVVGASARYNFGIADLFGEVATAQNFQRFAETTNSEAINSEAINGEASNSPHWGIGTTVGCRFYPTDGVSLIALYRYYSPWFDNALGYGFSETARIGDENGGYLGWDITRLRHWRFCGYADVFYFRGPKYGIPQSGTVGYDALAEARYSNNHQSSIINHPYFLSFRARARKKGDLSTYSARAQFNWQSGGWSLRTTAESNLTSNREAINYGITVYQDVSYSFPLRGGPERGLSIRLRVQGFDARRWDNRIYTYEHDVLYAFSIPAVYGLGGRAYICMKWHIIKQLALYLRVSETVCQRQWAERHDKDVSRTDVHFLLRAMF